MGISISSKRKAEEESESSSPTKKKARSEEESAKQPPPPPLIDKEKNAELERAKEESRRELIGRFSEALEAEFGCVICLEVFVEPTSLDCGHTFCSNCITDWKKLNYSCPTCRATEQMTLRKRAEIRNMINKVYEIFGGHELADRTSLLKEREEMEEKKKKVAARLQIAAAEEGGSRARVSLTRARMTLPGMNRQEDLEQPVLFGDIRDQVLQANGATQEGGAGAARIQAQVQVVVEPQQQEQQAPRIQRVIEASPPRRRRQAQRQAAINANAHLQSRRGNW
jgi:hypothetical protein